MENETGRRTEPEITPAMIEAGVRAVDPYDAPFLTPAEKVRLVFRAMLQASQPHGIHTAVQGHAD